VLARLPQELGARDLEPACHGRAVDAVRDRHALEAVAVDVVHAQECALLGGERGERGLERGLQLGAVAGLDRARLGIGTIGGQRHLVQVLVAGRGGVLAREVDGGARAAATRTQASSGPSPAYSARRGPLSLRPRSRRSRSCCLISSAKAGPRPKRATKRSTCTW
jgi:hypothetical protein